MIVLLHRLNDIHTGAAIDASGASEPSMPDTLEDLLTMCKIIKASTFEEAKELLDGRYFDMAILDIMGVYGYKLLDICND